VSATNPENGAVTYTYDPISRPVSRVDAKGQKTTYGYDNQGRIMSRRYYLPDGQGGFIEQPDQDIAWTYDCYPNGCDVPTSWGRLTQVTFGGGLGLSNGAGMSYRYLYDNLGRVSTQTLQAQVPLPVYNNWRPNTHTLSLNAQASLLFEDVLRNDVLYAAFGFSRGQ